jgi:hypothetical protein
MYRFVVYCVCAGKLRGEDEGEEECEREGWAENVSNIDDMNYMR